MGTEKFFIALTTLPVDHDADALARTLVDEKLAACVNIFPPMRSTYSWQGATETAEERQIVIKTSAARIRELEARLKSLHPYDVPEFVLIPIVDGSNHYLSWLLENTRP